MSVQVPPDVEASIRRMVEGGHYNDTDEALRAAVRVLDEHARRLRWLRAAVANADEQIERGEGIPYTKELVDEIGREVDERHRRGEQPRADVCP